MRKERVVKFPLVFSDLKFNKIELYFSVFVLTQEVKAQRNVASVIRLYFILNSF